MNCKSFYVLAVFCIFIVACHAPKEKSVTETPCKELNDLPDKIFLNGEQELNETALKYFKHPITDSCIRIWHWEHKSLDSSGYYKVNLFEYGFRKEKNSITYENDEKINSNNLYALYSTFETEGRDDSNLGWKVICVKTSMVNPISGWNLFYSKFKERKLDKIFEFPLGQSGSPNCSGCYTSLEYIFGNSITQLNFTAQHTIYQSKFPRDLAFVEMMELINEEFNLSINTY